MQEECKVCVHIGPVLIGSPPDNKDFLIGTRRHSEAKPRVTLPYPAARLPDPTTGLYPKSTSLLSAFLCRLLPLRSKVM